MYYEHSVTPVRDSGSKRAKFFARVKVSIPHGTSTDSYVVGKFAMMQTPVRDVSGPTFGTTSAYRNDTASIVAHVPGIYYVSSVRTDPFSPAPSGIP